MSIAENLKTLTKNEITVLSYKCKGLKYEQIKKRTGFSLGWVQLQMVGVYTKLGFSKDMHWSKRRDILENEVCPLIPKNLDDWEPIKTFRKKITDEVIQETREDSGVAEPVEEITEEPLVEATETDADPEMMALVLYDEAKLQEADLEDTKPRKVVPASPPVIVIPSKPPIIKRFGALIRLVLLILVLCIVGSFAYYLGRGSTSPTQPVVITATFPPAANPSDTALPIASEAFTPTITLAPIPTFTAMPTYTSKPTISLPFADNFSNGVSSPWTVVSGKWIVDSTGATITIMDGDNQTGSILLDDPSMTNYRLRVNVHSPNVLSAYQGGLAVVVRYRSDHDQNLAFNMNSANRFAWGYLSSLLNLDFYLPRITSVQKTNIISDFTLEIEVQGNNFVARVDGEKYDSFTMSGYETGGIALVTLCGNVGSCPSFSNFSLEPLP